MTIAVENEIEMVISRLRILRMRDSGDAEASFHF